MVNVPIVPRVATEIPLVSTPVPATVPRFVNDATVADVPTTMPEFPPPVVMIVPLDTLTIEPTLPAAIVTPEPVVEIVPALVRVPIVPDEFIPAEPRPVPKIAEALPILAIVPTVAVLAIDIAESAVPEPSSVPAFDIVPIDPSLAIAWEADQPQCGLMGFVQRRLG